MANAARPEVYRVESNDVGRSSLRSRRHRHGNNVNIELPDVPDKNFRRKGKEKIGVMERDETASRTDPVANINQEVMTDPVANINQEVMKDAIETLFNEAELDFMFRLGMSSSMSLSMSMPSVSLMLQMHFQICYQSLVVFH
jgi:hypothetical protein